MARIPGVQLNQFLGLFSPKCPVREMRDTSWYGTEALPGAAPGWTHARTPCVATATGLQLNRFFAAKWLALCSLPLGPTYWPRERRSDSLCEGPRGYSSGIVQQRQARGWLLLLARMYEALAATPRRREKENNDDLS